MIDQDELRNPQLESGPVKQDCIICGQPCSDFIGLTNGTRVHAQCYDSVVDSRASLKKEIIRLNTEKAILFKKLRRASSLVGKLGIAIFKSRNTTDQIQQLIDSLTLTLKDNATALEKNNQLLFDIHNYWKTYPSDWEERRLTVRDRASNSCELCGSTLGEKHIHHKTPIAKGGSHQLSNLLLLCVRCHSNAHGGRNVSREDRPFRETGNSGFQNKVDLIQEAIDQKATVRFSYQKYAGRKSVRAIRPEGLKTVGQSLCVYGHCYLRKGNRSFAIKRMINVRLSDSVGQCYYKE